MNLQDAAAWIAQRGTWPTTSDPPDDGQTPEPTTWRARSRRHWRRNGRPISSTNPRAAYWRRYKREKS